MANPRNLVIISVRLPKELVERADKFVAKVSPNVKNRTHLIEIALTEYLAKKS